MCMHVYWAGNTENKRNTLSSVMQKSSYISSKTNILSSYLMLSSLSLNSQPHHDTLQIFATFFFLMNFANSYIYL